jgi:hypothetical protein
LITADIESMPGRFAMRLRRFAASMDRLSCSRGCCRQGVIALISDGRASLEFVQSAAIAFSISATNALKCWARFVNNSRFLGSGRHVPDRLAFGDLDVRDL